MRRAFTTSTVLIVTLLFAALGCGSSGDLSRAATQRRFGVRMAKMSLWREAMFRFRRAVEIEPENAMAHNNLAVAFEANGDFEGALKEYREALRLDRGNQYIQKNYSRFVEFTQRSKKRGAPPATTTAPPATPLPPAATGAPAEAGSPPSPPATPNPPEGGV